MKILSSLQRVDCSVLHWTFLQRQRRLVVPCARLLSRTGDGYLPILTPIIFLNLNDPILRQLGWQIIVLFVIERIVYFVLKNTLKRQRPAETVVSFTAIIVASDKFSFPSGHTSAATLFAAIVSSHLPVLGGILFLWAAGVGLSRIILGVHYPSDILAGAILGLSIALLIQ